jgi:hypothetical protein
MILSHLFIDGWMRFDTIVTSEQCLMTKYTVCYCSFPHKTLFPLPALPKYLDPCGGGRNEWCTGVQGLKIHRAQKKVGGG